MAQLAVIGGAVALGGVAGGLIPGVGVLLGAQIGFLGGSILAGILFPNEVDVGGPSRDDVRLSSAATGRFIPIPLVGSVRIGGQYRWVDEPLITKTTTTEGGKGGGGTKVTTTNIFLTWNVGICEAPSAAGITAVTKIWLDDELVFDISEGNPIGPALLQSIVSGVGLPGTTSFGAGTQAVVVTSWGPIRIYLGAEGQPVEPLMQVDERITEAMGSDAVNWVSPANGLCHCTFERVPGDAINFHFPQCEFEVLVDGTPVMVAESFEPVNQNTQDRRKNLLEDRNTTVVLDTTTDPILFWNFIDKNPKDPVVLEWEAGTDLGVKLMGPNNVGTFDDPDLRVVGFTGTGDTRWRSFSAARGVQISQLQTIDPIAGAQPIGGWYYPNTRNAERFIWVAETTDDIVSMPTFWEIPDDLETLTIIRRNLAIPEVGIASVSFLAKPGFIGPDGLLYIVVGESNASHNVIVAFDPVTLNVERVMEPYRDSPGSDDPFWGETNLTYDIQHDKIILVTQNYIRKVDRETLTIEGDDIFVLAGMSENDANYEALIHGPYAGKLWQQAGSLGNTHSEFDIVGMRHLRTIDVDDWAAPETLGDLPTYDPWNHGLWTGSFGNADYLQFLPLDRQGPACGSPAVIAKNISDRCDVPASLRDTSAWSGDLICGYMIGRRISGRRCLDVIAGAINGDYRTQDGLVNFYKNDTSPIFTVPEDQLGYGDTLEAGVARRDIRWPYERELPQRIDIQYIDRQMDYSSNTQPFDRPLEGFRGRDRQTVQMPIVFDTASDPTPLQIAERLLYQFDLNRESHLQVLSFEYLNSNVGDAFSYTKGTRTHTVRIEKWALAENNKIIIQSKSEDISINTGSGEAGNAGSLIFERPTLDLSSGGQLFILDTSLLRFTDNAVSGVVVYLAVSPVGSIDSFGGGSVLQSKDGGATWNNVAAFHGGQACQWGVVATAVQETRPGIINHSSLITINMHKGILPASVSEADMDASDIVNAIIYGRAGRWEILRYRTSVDSDGSPDESGDVYVVSNLRRGLANTEQNTENHQDGDTVILLEPSKLVLLELPLTDIGVTNQYKFVPAGMPESSAVPQDFTLVGNAMKPVLVVEVQGSRNISTGDWTITWRRGGRINYEWVDSVSTPLGEDSEEYEIDVLTAPGGTVVAGLTQTALSSATATITETDLVANGLGIDGSPGQSPFGLTLNIYQISAKIGRGHTQEITVSSPTPGN